MAQDYTTEDEALEVERTVYEFKDKIRTTSSKKFDEFLESQFSELPPSTSYHKIKGVNIETKKFKEVRDK